MTQAIVSAVVNKLADLLVEEVRSLSGVDRKLDEVKFQLGQMQCFLIDAEFKKKGDERIKGWVRDVRNVAYETEDAIDKYLVEANNLRLGFIPNRPLARRTLGEKISEIQAKLSLITQSRSTFGIKDLGEHSSPSESSHQKQSSFKRHVHPDIDNNEVVGFHVEKKEIINLLLSHPSDQNRCVVSIVGPGGLGKTTLAQQVYTCSDVRNHFDSCLWIIVSQDYNLHDILKKIYLNFANYKELGGESQKDQIVFLLGKVNALLKENKYLIVLDDVWTEDVFTQLETSLVDVRNGSRVLMTTRFLNIANRADSSGVYVYPLRFLNKEESFGLFLKKAFPTKTKCPDELSDIATKLVKKCDGLPLALTVLGGLLSSKTTYLEWSKVLKRLDWHKVDGGECMKVLATSYDDLSYFLKSCFRYLACFPEDYTIEAKHLMLMWIAEGLIEVQKEEELEDSAEDYLEELVQRCLVQVGERSPDGDIVSIRIHDLLREVALGEATENDFLFIWKEQNAGSDVRMTRRVAFHHGIDWDVGIYNPIDLTKIKMPKLRTFLDFGRHSFMGIGFFLLRVLELRGAVMTDLPTDLKSMIHLRYLGLADSKVTIIPSWIGNLQNLQTFDITDTRIQELPKSFWKITSLRHVLYAPPLLRYSFMVGPPSIASLVNLRSLVGFLVPKLGKKCFPHFLGVRELKLCCYDENDGMLIHDLQSKLNNLLSVTFYNFYPLSGMIDFSTSPSYQNIHTMHLSGTYRHEDPPTVHIAEMPPNLAKLILRNFHLNDNPMLKLEKLCGLKYLVLDNIRLMEVDTIVCTYGGFPRLQSLKLNRVNKMKEWKVEYGGFPMLKYLLIIYCEDLHALPDLQCVTTLQELTIDPKLQSQIENKSGMEWDKVKHIPTIIESHYFWTSYD